MASTAEMHVLVIPEAEGLRPLSLARGGCLLPVSSRVSPCMGPDRLSSSGHQSHWMQLSLISPSPPLWRPASGQPHSEVVGVRTSRVNCSSSCSKKYVPVTSLGQFPAQRKQAVHVSHVLVWTTTPPTTVPSAWSPPVVLPLQPWGEPPSPGLL